VKTKTKTKKGIKKERKGETQTLKWMIALQII